MASVDQNGRRIICLANSRKPDGRCIAGKLYFQGKFGKGINSFNSRLLLTRLHSLNGSTIEIYNLGNKILKRLEQHRENAARNL